MTSDGPGLDERPVSHSPFGLLFGVSLHQQAVLFRQLATMIDGGLTSARAIDTLSGHAGGHFGAALREMATRLNEGWPLHRALGLFPEYFSELVVCLVRAGETGGMLDVRLKEIADFLEQSYDIRQRMVSQAVYPILILHAAIFVPPIVEWVTKGPSAYLATVVPRLVILYGALIALFAGARMLSLNSGIRFGVDSTLLYVPLLGKVLRDGALMRALRALGDLLEAGIPTSQALEIASRAGGNLAVGHRMLNCARIANTGVPLSTAMAQAHVVPPMVMQMIVSGEQTGSMGASINKAAELLKIDFDNAVKRMAAAAPAILMLFVAGFVGWQYITFFRQYFDQINQIMP
jgi:type IV pilus assembly protein PilC